jgi:hypothetical protein
MLVNTPFVEAGNDGMVPGAVLLGAGVAFGMAGDLMKLIGIAG